MSSGRNRKTKRLFVVRALLVSGAALTITSCAATGIAKHSPRHESTYLENAVTLPFDAYLYHPAALSRRHAELSLHLSSCVSERGGTYEPPPFVAPPLPRFYGIVDADEASAFGYRPPASGSEEAVPPIDAATQAILYGSPENAVVVRDTDGTVLAELDPDSCYAQAQTIVQPDWVEVLEIESRLDRYISASFREAEEDALLIDGWREWSTCMDDRGFEFEDPWAPYYSIWPGDEPRAEEIATAVADVQCKRETRLLRTWSNAVADRQDRILAESVEALADWERWLELNDDWVGS